MNIYNKGVIAIFYVSTRIQLIVVASKVNASSTAV